MSRLRDRLERDLHEVAADARPSPSAWESIVARLDDDAESGVALVLAPAPDRAKRSVWPAVVAAAFVVIVGSIAVLTRVGDNDSISPADPDATTAPSVAPPSTVVWFPTLTATFVSPRNGFSVEYPDRGEGTITPSTGRWDPGSGQLVDNEFVDGVDAVETGAAAVFMGSSAEIPDGVSIDDWVDDHVSPSGCGGRRTQQAEFVIDGHVGRISECRNQMEATVVAGGRLYLFTLAHDRRDARAVFDIFAATIDLTPETAASP